MSSTARTAPPGSKQEVTLTPAAGPLCVSEHFSFLEGGSGEQSLYLCVC